MVTRFVCPCSLAPVYRDVRGCGPGCSALWLADPVSSLRTYGSCDTSNEKKRKGSRDLIVLSLFSCFFSALFARQLKLKLEEINQNPFRQGLLDSTEVADDGGGGGGASGDVSEDMSWGFDQTFFGEEGRDGDDEPDDYDDI